MPGVSAPMEAAEAEETELVKRLVTGDRVAFEVIYRRHNASMVRFAAAIVKSRETAEELAQETWLSVLRGVAGFEGRSSLAGWIFAILANKARTRAKRDGRMVSFDAGGEDDSLAAAFDGRGRWKNLPELWEEVTPERVIAGRTALDHVARAIEALPPAQRAALILRGQEGLDAEEVCAILEITEGNMRVLLHRARLAVRRALDQTLA
jgi:RNA polymerase sigma-70 factor (ECF subfamily)